MQPLLWTRHRIRSTLYEGHPERIGGRCWSLRDYFSNGLITEHGGAFIDSNQYAALDLAAELGLQLEDYNGGELIGLPEVYWFDGGYYTYAQASADWEAFGYKAFHDAVNEFEHGARDSRVSTSCPRRSGSTRRRSAARHRCSAS